ncbi:pseudaminic acid synthase [Salinibacter ruber]|uniref:Pseudaminic acid synthase n=1 Tax=Salinibacter ruber TaxID=146919 RepID=A0A9X2Q9D3_9BACT|nr:pseudaminic acid synthase [Salinibacter ruber]MCS3661161.1 pseudaminic acid synthase [Salinibacter ruber]MCS3710960.1 pseudaminic acid synthase [Salinibacter ruber]
MCQFNIGNREIADDTRTYIVAEMSANHHQDFGRAENIIRAAADAGADAIKLQTSRPDRITIDSDKEPFRIKQGPWQGKTLYELYEETYTPWEWQPKLQQTAHDLGLDLFSSPFDPTAVDFLEEMGVPAYKVASFEIVDLPLIRQIAETGKPTIMSTGMATLGEIDEAVRAFREAGGTELALLACTSSYPAPPDEMHLRRIPHLAETFDVVPGLSDHTLGTEVPVAGVSLGARIIEKHLTLSREDKGPDSDFSLEPDEFADMVRAVRKTEKALGEVRYQTTEKESESERFRRSLFVVQDIDEGEPFSEENVRSIRPGDGMSPKHINNIIGRKASQPIAAGTPLRMGLVR